MINLKKYSSDFLGVLRSASGLVLAGKRRAVSRDKKRASPGLRSVVHPGQKESAEPWPTDRPTVYLFSPSTHWSEWARGWVRKEESRYFPKSARWGSVKRARREVDGGKIKKVPLSFFLF